jgi:hypothetical protein
VVPVVRDGVEPLTAAGLGVDGATGRGDVVRGWLP